MKTTNFQTQCAAVLLAGLILAGLGAWGTWYFSSKSAGEKEGEWALKEQQLNDEISSLIQANEDLRAKSGSSPQPAMSSPQVDRPKAKATPALISSDTGAPIPGASPSESQPNKSWNLSDKQRQKIVDSLGKHGGKTITICSVESDPEGLAFAGTLKHLFEEAGWHVDGVKQVVYPKPPVGLNLVSGSFPAPEGAIATYRAFAAVGFHVSQQLDAKLIGDEAELIVGATQ